MAVQMPRKTLIPCETSQKSCSIKADVFGILPQICQAATISRGSLFRWKLPCKCLHFCLSIEQGLSGAFLYPSRSTGAFSWSGNSLYVVGRRQEEKVGWVPGGCASGPQGLTEMPQQSCYCWTQLKTFLHKLPSCPIAELFTSCREDLVERCSSGVRKQGRRSTDSIPNTIVAHREVSSMRFRTTSPAYSSCKQHQLPWRISLLMCSHLALSWLDLAKKSTVLCALPRQEYN